jgi:RES domain-containing protein
VDCADIADMGDDAGRQALAVAMDELACAWEDRALRGEEPPSRRLARRLMSERYAGIVVPSFAPGAPAADRNVVFWQWSSVLPHKLLVIDDEARLPRNSRSWEH